MAILGVYLFLFLVLLRGTHVPHAGQTILLSLLSSTLTASAVVLLAPLFLLWGAVYLLVLWRQLRRWDSDGQGTFLLRRGARWVRVYWYNIPDPGVPPAAMKWYLGQ